MKKVLITLTAAFGFLTAVNFTLADVAAERCYGPAMPDHNACALVTAPHL